MVKINYRVLIILLFHSSPSFANGLESLFTNVYIHNAWGDSDSASGTGSNLTQTATIREELPKVFKKLSIMSILDAPCGDFFWMKKISNIVKLYIGMDIVKDIIDTNNTQYQNEHQLFIHGDITKDSIPTVDLILCRDCLVHFSYEDIKKTIKNFKRSKSKYLLTTTFTQRGSNKNIQTGDWRPLNLQKAPFNFPPPLIIVNEHCTEDNGIYADKSLAVWLLDDLTYDE